MVTPELEALLRQLAANPASLRALMAQVGDTAVGAGPQAPPAALSLAPAWSPDDLLTVEEAAAVLRVSPRWLYRHAKKLPFSRKLSRKVLRFSRAGITRWLATKRA